MIGNISRTVLLNQCRQKMYNIEVLRLHPPREAEPLMTGEAVHAGIESFILEGDVNKAVALCEATYRKRLEGQLILPEEREMLEREIAIAKAAVRSYEPNYAKAEYQVLFPEVEFQVPLPDSLHHCYFVHKLIHPDIPYKRCANDDSLLTGDEPFECWQPYFFRGKTDAVIEMNRMVWILEHKTSGINTDNWWNQWLLDIQPTGYMYGVWKSTGIRPAGFLLNKIHKPNKRTIDVSSVQFSREPYLRTEADLQRFETQFLTMLREYERAIAENQIWMNTSACFDWNRKCYFHRRCLNHQQSEPGEFSTKPLDYVDLAYYKLLNLEPPKGAVIANIEENSPTA